MRVVRAIVLAALAGGASACTPAAVVDAAASELAISPSILDDDPAPPDGKLAVVVQFAQGGAYVELAATTTVTCNGVALAWTDLGYAGRVPVVAAGGTFAIAHARGGVTTQVSMPVPERPRITSPVEGATLGRGTDVAVGYVAATSAGVRPGVSDATTGVSGNEQPDTGSATIDASSLKPGAGTLGLTRRYATSPAGTGFASVSATYAISSASVHVTWQ